MGAHPLTRLLAGAKLEQVAAHGHALGVKLVQESAGVALHAQPAQPVGADLRRGLEKAPIMSFYPILSLKKSETLVGRRVELDGTRKPEAHRLAIVARLGPRVAHAAGAAHAAVSGLQRKLGRVGQGTLGENRQPTGAGRGGNHDGAGGSGGGGAAAAGAPSFARAV